jgi:hypothetical protein
VKNASEKGLTHPRTQGIDFRVRMLVDEKLGFDASVALPLPKAPRSTSVSVTPKLRAARLTSCSSSIGVGYSDASGRSSVAFEPRGCG